MRLKYMRKISAWSIAVLLMICCCSCGNSGETAGEQQTAEEAAVSSIDLAELRERMLAADTTLPEMKLVTSEDAQAEVHFTAVSDIDYEKIDSYFYAYAADGGAQEIVVAVLKNESDAAVLMRSFHEHLDLRQGGLAEYAPDQLALVEHAVIKQKGNLVTLIICEKSGLVQKAFEE